MDHDVKIIDKLLPFELTGVADLEGKRRTASNALITAEPGRLPSVSVIIPAYTMSRWNDLLESVASAQAQTVPALETVVVIDHNPELLARAISELPYVIAVPNVGARGVSGARNSGVMASRGEVVAFLDDDAVAAPDWLATLLRYFQGPEVIGIGCHVDGLWEAPCPRWFPAEFGWTLGVSYRGMPKRAVIVRNVWTCGMILRRAAFEMVGGFRDNFGKVGDRSLPEDTDLCLRITSAYDKAVWISDPAKLMGHRVPANRMTLNYFLTRCFYQGWGKAAMADMDGFSDSTSTERSYTRRILPAGVGRGLVEAARGDAFGMARSVMIAVGFVVTVAGWLSFRREKLSRRIGRVLAPLMARSPKIG
jgi:O-antigen biosynthesis protein